MLVGTVRSLHRYPFKSMDGEDLTDIEMGPRGIPADRIFALRDEVRGEIRGAKNWPVLMLCSAAHRDGQLVVRLPEDAREYGVATEREKGELSEALSALIGTRVRVYPLVPASNRDHYRRKIPGSRLGGLVGRSRTLALGIQRAAAMLGADYELREAFGREPGESLPDLTVFPPELFEFVSPPGTYFDAYPIHIVTSATIRRLEQLDSNVDWNVRRFRPNLVLETDRDDELAWSGRELAIGEVVLRCEMPTPRCSMVMQPQRGVDKDPRVLRTIVRELDHCVGLYASVKTPGRVRRGDLAKLL